MQRSWDTPIVAKTRLNLLQSLTSDADRARLLAVSSAKSGAWLHALPISACGLLLEDEAVRVSIGFRLGAKVCEPHTCPCGSEVDARGTHSLACRRGAGRVNRHNFINDIIWRSLARAEIPSTKEPVGLTRTDGKRPDGLTLVPWRSGKSAVWDVTVTDTLARSYLHLTASSAGGAAESASTRKLLKYDTLSASYEVVPIAMETLGPTNALGAAFINEVGKRTTQATGDSRETSFLWQRLSMALQRFNAVCFKQSFIHELELQHDQG